MFLVVLVDVIGFSIVIPLLPFYALRFGATPLIATTLVTVYAVCSLISTPLIGKLSDDYGRKRLLMISQAGTLAGFVILALSNSLWMVFVGRIIDGCTAGNLSTAQAYISDHTPPENRAKSFGIIGIAFGVGYMAGPWLGGQLAEYGLHLPFVVAGCMSAFSIFCTYTLLPKEEPPRVNAADGPQGPAGKRPSAFDWRTYAEYFSRPHVRGLYLQFFAFSFAFSAFMSGFALFSMQNPHFLWTPREVGYMFAYAGLCGIVIQGGLLGKLVKRYSELKLATVAFFVWTIAFALMGVSTAVWMLVVVATLNAFGHGVLRPVIMSRLSQAVGKHEQGVVLGISGSLSSLAMAFAPPVGGFMLNHDWLFAWAMVPTVVSAIGLVLTLAGGRAPTRLAEARVHSGA